MAIEINTPIILANNAKIIVTKQSMERIRFPLGKKEWNFTIGVEFVDENDNVIKKDEVKFYGKDCNDVAAQFSTWTFLLEKYAQKKGLQASIPDSESEFENTVTQ
jgi:hypothetical protein